jgi:hypothetical protein
MRNPALTAPPVEPSPTPSPLDPDVPQPEPTEPPEEPSPTPLDPEPSTPPPPLAGVRTESR